jgi:hypothetical protein
MSERFTYEGFDFIMELTPDLNGGPPWKDDGHGVVSEWRPKDSKRPGERILHTDGSSCRFYDWQETMLKARGEGWGIYQPPAGLTKRAIAALAVEQDFERMRRWCNDEWWYVGVVVMLDEEGSKEARSCWGIESDCEDHIKEMRNDLAAELLPDNRMERFMRKAAAT